MSGHPGLIGAGGGPLALPPLRPQLGGPSPDGPVSTTTGPPGPGGNGAGASPAPEQYATYLVLLSAAVFGVVGFFQGAQRTFTAFLFTIGSALVIGGRWSQVVALVNRLYRLTLFLLQGGPLAADPSEAWATAKEAPGIVPVDGASAAFWQLVFFAAAVLVGYGVGILLFGAPKDNPLDVRAVGTLLNRLFGAFFGALIGATVALFVLPRVVPGAQLDMVGPGSVLRHLVDQYGTLLFWSFVILMIVAGLMALRPKPSSKVFN